MPRHVHRSPSPAATVRTRTNRPVAASPHALQQLQRTAGNRAVTRLVQNRIPPGIQRLEFEYASYIASWFTDQDATRWKTQFAELQAALKAIKAEDVPTGSKSSLRKQYQQLQKLVAKYADHKVPAADRQAVGREIADLHAAVVGGKLPDAIRSAAQNRTTPQAEVTPPVPDESPPEPTVEEAAANNKPEPVKPTLSKENKQRRSAALQKLDFVAKALSDATIAKDENLPAWKEQLKALRRDFGAGEISDQDVVEKAAETDDLAAEVDETWMAAQGFETVEKKQKAYTVQEFETKGLEKGADGLPVGRKAAFRYLDKATIFKPGVCSYTRVTGQDKNSGSFTAFFTVDGATDTEIHAHYEHKSGKDEVVKSHFKPSSDAGTLGHGRNSLSADQLKRYVEQPFDAFVRGGGTVHRRP